MTMPNARTLQKSPGDAFHLENPSVPRNCLHSGNSGDTMFTMAYPTSVVEFAKEPGRQKSSKNGRSIPRDNGLWRGFDLENPSVLGFCAVLQGIDQQLARQAAY
jgi:hypothetical protein